MFTHSEAQTFYLLAALVPEALMENMLAPLVPYMVRMLSSDVPADRIEAEIGGRVGMMTAVFYFPLLLMNIVWGSLSDRIGRKPVLLMGLFFCGLTTLILGINTTSFAVAIMCRFLAGVFGGNSAVAKGALGEINQTEKGRSWAYAVYSQLYAVFGIIGPLLGGFLVSASRSSGASDYPYLAACGVGTALSVVSLAVSYFLFEEPARNLEIKPATKKDDKASLADASDVTDSEDTMKVEDDDRAIPAEIPFTLFSWAVCLPILLYVLIAFANMYWVTVLPLLFSSKLEAGGLGFTPLDTSFAISVRAISKLFFSTFVSRGVVARLGSKHAYNLGMAAIIPASYILGILHSITGNELWIGVSVSMALLGFVESVVYLSVMMMISASVPPAYLGVAFGFSSTCAAAMRTIAPPLSGFGWELASSGAYGPWSAFALLHIVAVLSIGAAVIGFLEPPAPVKTKME
ncbi:hypothetical protein HDU78_007906 [Chytriomyces hyalinus]|nr:hypothetical protein HDU78_007906 [Chytriomyces hyalinus]